MIRRQQIRQKMVTRDKAPVKSGLFFLASTGEGITDVYKYFNIMFPKANTTSRPLRSAIASSRDDVDAETQKHLIDLMEHSETMDKNEYVLNSHRLTKKQSDARKAVQWMQQLVKIMEEDLLGLLPIDQDVYLQCREILEFTLKSAVGVTFKDNFVIKDSFIDELQDNWRRLAGEHFIDHVAKRAVLENKDIDQLDLGKNNAFKRHWRLISPEIRSRIAVKTA